MKALVTGATGFIGNHLVRELVRKRYKVRCLVRETSNVMALERLGVELWFGDVTDKESLKGVADGMDLVFHLAAVGDINATSEKDYNKYREVNVNGTKNLLQECAKSKSRNKNKIKKIVYFSSVTAMGPLKKGRPIDEKDRCKPTTPYGKSKHESELAALKFWRKRKTPVIILRPTMVYGEGERKEASKIEKSVKLRIVPIIGDGSNTIHMVHVKDVVRAAIMAARKGKIGEVYIISSEHHTWDELVDLTAQKMGINVAKVHVPVFMSKPLVSVVEKVSEVFGVLPLITSERLESFSTDRDYDISKARKELGYRPTIKFLGA